MYANVNILILVEAIEPDAQRWRPTAAVGCRGWADLLARMLFKLGWPSALSIAALEEDATVGLNG